MTIEQAKAELAELKTQDDAIWAQHKILEAQNEELMKPWHVNRARQAKLKAFIELADAELPKAEAAAAQ
jgi:hypothetical protein